MSKKADDAPAPAEPQPVAPMTHHEAVAALAINAAIHRINAGRPADAIGPLNHALGVLGEPAPQPAGGEREALADELSLLLEDEDLDGDKLESAAADLLPRIHDHLRAALKEQTP